MGWDTEILSSPRRTLDTVGWDTEILSSPRRTLDAVRCGLRLTFNSHREHSTRWGGGSDWLHQRGKHSTRWGVERSAHRLARLLPLQSRQRGGGRSAATTATTTRTSSRPRIPSSAVDCATGFETRLSTPSVARSARVSRRTRRDAGPVEDDQHSVRARGGLTRCGPAHDVENYPEPPPRLLHTRVPLADKPESRGERRPVRRVQPRSRPRARPWHSRRD